MRYFQKIIRVYQLFLSPIVHSIVPVQSSCRFHPTCSAYAKDAFGRFGIFYGCWLTLKRLARCHPWGKAGFDPVPEKPLNTHDDSICNTHLNR